MSNEAQNSVQQIENGQRMFALEKAINLNAPNGAGAKQIVQDAETFLAFIKPAPVAKPTLLQVRQ